MKFLRYLLAFLFGAFAGLLIYMEASMVFFTSPPAWFVFLTFFGGWGLTAHWVARSTRTLSEMFSRMALLSAILSFGLTPAIMVLSAKLVDTSGSGAEVAGSFIGGGLASGFGTAISLGLTFLSLLAFGLIKLFNRERGLGGGLTVPCPSCAEPIQAQAKKCKHCGEFVGATS